MGKLHKWLKGSIYTEPLSPGCKLCAKGAKMVLLVTGLCPASCFYCPLSEKKRGKDVIYADEWKLESEEEESKILKECELIDAEGAGFTGGDPLVVWKRTKRYITLLKEIFGDKFHIHLYTSGLRNAEHIPDLLSAGLDEIRFHPMPIFWSDMEKSPLAKVIEKTVGEGIDVAIEIPSIPGMEREIKSLIEWSNEKGVKWVNLNELEFSHTNADELIKRGFDVRDDISSAVKGSEETAKAVINEVLENLSIGLHYCSSSFKDAVQLRNRIKRRAKNVAKEFDIVTDEGLLLKGVIDVCDKTFVNYLVKRFNLPTNLIRFDEEKRRIEIAPWVLEEIAGDLKREGIDCYLIEEYPTADRLEVERIPLE